MTRHVVHKAILTHLRRHLDRPVLTRLLRELQQAHAVERRLLGAAGGRDLLLTGRDALDHVITVCSAQLKPWYAAHVILGIGDVFRDHGDLPRAEELYNLAIAHGITTGDEGATGEAYLQRGDLYSRLGRWKDSHADLHRSRRIATRLRDRTALGRIDNLVGTNYALQGNLKKAALFYERALSAFGRTNEKVMTGVVLMNIGIMRNMSGAYDEALGHYRRAQQYFDRQGNVQRLMELHHNIGMSYFFKQAYKDAAGHFNSCIKYASRLRNVNTLALATLGKAATSHGQQDYRLALVLVNRALALFSQCNDRNGLADAYKVKGMILRELMQLNTAASLLQTSLRLNAELQNELNSGESRYELGILERMRGNTKQARAAFKEALRHFRQVGARREIERTMKMLTDTGIRKSVRAAA